MDIREFLDDGGRDRDNDDGYGVLEKAERRFNERIAPHRDEPVVRTWARDLIRIAGAEREIKRSQY